MNADANTTGNIQFFADKGCTRPAEPRIGRVAWVRGESAERIYCPGTDTFELFGDYIAWRQSEKERRRRIWEGLPVAPRKRREALRGESVAAISVAGDIAPGFCVEV